jgi:hypothetical protein
MKNNILDETKEELITRIGMIQALDHDFEVWLMEQIEIENGQINDKSLAFMEVLEKFKETK